MDPYDKEMPQSQITYAQITIATDFGTSGFIIFSETTRPIDLEFHMNTP